MNWLADQVGEPHLEARRHEMYERALRCIWSLDDRYRDRWEEEEEEHAAAIVAQTSRSMCRTPKHHGIVVIPPLVDE